MLPSANCLLLAVAGRRTRGDQRLHQPEEHPGRGGEGADHLPGDHPQTLLEGKILLTSVNKCSVVLVTA